MDTEGWRRVHSARALGPDVQCRRAAPHADVPPEGEPIDPMGFLGLRCRIAYTSHVAVPASRSLGALDATHRAHFLYWGDSPNDITGEEARWQRSRWGALHNQVFVPKAVQNAKAELLTLLNDPPSPTSLIYLFCQCNTGAGNNPTLRIGSTNDLSNVIMQTDFGTSALADRPLVFGRSLHCQRSGGEVLRARLPRLYRYRDQGPDHLRKPLR
jgi:hypothetical protein